jgi:hypothetical protein
MDKYQELKQARLEKREVNIKRSRAICLFFKKRKDLKKLPICQKVGYDSSNLAKCIRNTNRHIAANFLSDFERVLKVYGFIPYLEEDAEGGKD